MKCPIASPVGDRLSGTHWPLASRHAHVGLPHCSRGRSSELRAAGVAQRLRLHAYRQDPDAARYQSWGTDYSRADAERLVGGQREGKLASAGDLLQLAVRETTSGTLLWDLTLHRLDEQPRTFELGVTLARVSQGQRVASEALTARLDFVFDHEEAHRVVAFQDSHNGSVARLLTRVGSDMRRGRSTPTGSRANGAPSTAGPCSPAIGTQHASSRRCVNAPETGNRHGCAPITSGDREYRACPGALHRSRRRDHTSGAV
ncbi:GNAT family N-acetyltransferase [Curtobacterium sp. 9128]|uniref:GNAT family N-acetyltransferase n=1 Tax=Curtobacterium sp. 9128 TaxID=1793722 RepID=UPI0011A018A6